MKAALIAPKGYERTALASDIHLVLPLPQLINNWDYVDAYQVARERGDYIILDNGCAEGKLVNGKTLVRFAARIRAHEIVAPDVMGETMETLVATRKWLIDNEEAHDYNIMGVLQGENWFELLKAYSDMPAITTVGVPKVHISQHGSLARYDIVETINKHFEGRFKIHLLGLNGKFPNEIRTLNYSPAVRSMDSAQPYKVTELAQRMTEDNCWGKRRPTYFDEVVPLPTALLMDNIRTFISWAEGKKNEGGRSRR